MISKIRRGNNTGRLVKYLYSRGRGEARHVDPHLVACWAGPVAWLEPGPGLNPGRDKIRQLAEVLDEPLADNDRKHPDDHVWHLSLRNHPDDRVLSDQEWAEATGVRAGSPVMLAAA